MIRVTGIMSFTRLAYARFGGGVGLGFRHRRQRILTASEQARRVHSAWLTRALSGESGELPRIPARRVEEGGFLWTSQGRQWAADWWRRLLEKLE
jgi:hypothetical protein